MNAERAAEWLREHTGTPDGDSWGMWPLDLQRAAAGLSAEIAAEVESLRKRAEEAEAERDYWKTEAVALTSQLNHTPTGGTP